MEKFQARLKVIFKAFVFWLFVASSTVSAAAAAVATTDVPADVKVTAGATAVSGVVASAVVVIRRVTVVAKELRGILLPDEPEFFNEFWGDDT